MTIVCPAFFVRSGAVLSVCARAHVFILLFWSCRIRHYVNSQGTEDTTPCGLTVECRSSLLPEVGDGTFLRNIFNDLQYHMAS
jgi:hypothetical protein